MTELVTSNPAIDERLENIFRQLLDLYERHAQERQLMLTEKEELLRLVQLLVAQTKEIGQYEQGIRKRIQDCIKSAADTSMQLVEQRIINNYEYSLNDLKKIIEQSRNDTPLQIGNEHNQRAWFNCNKVVIIIAGILIVFLIAMLQKL
jgi:hypothetical protein